MTISSLKCISIVACAAALGLMTQVAVAGPAHGPRVQDNISLDFVPDPLNLCTQDQTTYNGNPVTCDYIITNNISNTTPYLSDPRIRAIFYTSTNGRTVPCTDPTDVNLIANGGGGVTSFDVPDQGGMEDSCMGHNLSYNIVTTAHDSANTPYYVLYTAGSLPDTSSLTAGYTGVVTVGTAPVMNGSLVVTPGTLIFTHA